MNNPLRYYDPTGEDVFLVLYGSGSLSTDMIGGEHDVGQLFEQAAETADEDIKNDPEFVHTTKGIEMKPSNPKRTQLKDFQPQKQQL